MTRVVLDAVAKAHRLEHLKIIIGALLQTLRLEQLVGRLELRHALLALFADRFQSRLDLRLLGHVVRCRPYGDGLVLTKHLTGDLIDLGNQLDLVAKELKPQRMLGIRRIHVDNIAAHAERAACQVIVIAIILNVDKCMDKVIALERHLLVDVWSQTRIVLRRANAIDTRDRCDNDHIASREQRCGRLMSQHLNLFVNRGVFLDICIALRHIRLGLIVVVVRDEVDHSVVGKELFELARKLSGERFIRSHDQRRLSQGLNSLCHREGLARTSHAQQNLIAVSVPHALHKRLNGLRLGTGRLIGRHDLKRHVRAFNAKALKFTTNAFYFKFRHGYS